eukprot:CAMPEP_0202905332 /NCGR_PEP_ID=MMETSP1392-20130828/33724_1 /ASSEMBLY_ACC=CAM_ASM_000868 /TAXON_ID=225041 /ORGANISM="Chlamydomonas chlamydogama, Strain SAG 11-48b" /LENGTH=49 /DNA_ID= /DNA_START= /DNA_END= /DNA_ORIENTATION=
MGPWCWGLDFFGMCQLLLIKRTIGAPLVWHSADSLSARYEATASAWRFT